MTTNDEGELRVHKARLTILFIVALVLGVAVTGSYFLVFDGALPDDHAVWGMFGDFVGGTLNPIFALFALAALLYTISLQVHELQAVRKELAQTSETANRQNFEHTFFQMIRLHHDIVARIDVTPDHLSAHDSPTDFKGPTAFKTFCKELDEHLNYYHGEPLEDRREYIQLAWSEFFEARYPSIIHYFRHLFALLLFVKEHAPNGDVAPYIMILQAQLSAHELKLLFYNGLQASTKATKKLYEDTGFLSALNKLERFAAEQHASIESGDKYLYEAGAFGSN